MWREKYEVIEMSSSSSPDSQGRKYSYDDDSFETSEESFVADGKSSPILLGRRESVFLAESSSSSIEESFNRHGLKSRQALSEESISESCKTILSENIVESENSVSDAEDNEGQISFIKKKLVLLSSGSIGQNREKGDKDQAIQGSNEINKFCSNKLKIISKRKQKDNKNCCEEVAMTAEQPDHQPVVGNNGKIESLKIENLMHKMEKIKQKDFHNPTQCSNCWAMKSDTARKEFLKRKLVTVKRAEFEERLQTHLYQKDSATLIAKIANSCTKATEPTSEVWEKLLHNRGNK